MVTITRFVAIAGIALAVGACAKKEPEPIMVMPDIDKMGNATCPGGMALAIDGATGNQVCVDPATI